MKYETPTLITISEEEIKERMQLYACSTWVFSCVGNNLVGYDPDIYYCMQLGSYDSSKCLSGLVYNE